MRRGSPRGLLSLGLIGVGPSWERRYRPAVRRLSERMRIRAVYDPVLSRAQSVAQEIEADVATGLMQIIGDPCLHGVLMLDHGWYGLVPLDFACECQKPVFFSGNWHESASTWQRFAEVAQQQGPMLVPEFPLRFQPATTRLRELIASRVGPVRHIQLRILTGPTADASEPQGAVASAIDWCCYVTRRSAESLSLIPGRSPQWHLHFRADARNGTLDPAQIELGHVPPEAIVDQDFILEAFVECAQGTVHLLGPTDIRWQVSDAAETAENLEHERSCAELMLDQFCRRLVGGLIPIATIGDVAAALEQIQRVRS